MARVDTSRLEGILAASKVAPVVAPVVTPEPVVDDTYYTKVLASGKTQAQIDALRGAYDTAAAINERVTSISPVTGSTVDRTTGKVTTTYKDPNMIQMLNGILYKGGIPFSGDQGYTRYVNGIPTESYDPKTNKWGPYTAAPGPTGTPGPTGLKTDAQIAADAAKAQAQGERQSAYDLLYSQFKLYGLESLVEPLKGLIITGASPAEFTIKLRDSDAYKLRFAANAKRIANGFKAIDEATYLGLEDRYQSIMQNYGLPESYYKKGSMGVQEGFEKFIANNVDPVTLEERIMEGVKINQGSKALIDTAKQFYPSLTDGDFLAYALDPKNALSEIRRKVTATEIGSAQIGAGLAATVGGAEELARAGVTGKQYQQAAPTIAEAALRGGQLADIYKQSPYTQQTAESLLLDLPGSAEALKKTKKLTSLETAQFGGSAGAGAIARDRAGVL
jgi:hypothetical protein